MTATDPIRRVSVISTGSVQIRPEHVAATWQPRELWLLTSRRWTAPRPINVYVIEHRAGVVLFDTGQDRASVTDPRYFPSGITGFLYGRLATFEIEPHQTLRAQLSGLGIDSRDVDHAIVSHLHQDHIGGLAELTGAEILVSKSEWDTLGAPLPELNGLMRRHIQLPGLNWRQIQFETTSDPALAPFDAMHDLFGDGSLVLVPTPGHTPGSMTLLVRRPGQASLALVGDLTYDDRLLEQGHVPGVGKKSLLRETTRKINEFRGRNPELAVLAAHDPGAADGLARTTRLQD